MADWTPMEKAKPEKSGRYWISFKSGDVKIATYDAFNDYFSSGNLAQIMDCAITAWQPMEYPAPYEPPMTEAEALKELSDPIVAYNPRSGLGKALNLAREALEKRIPKRVSDNWEDSYYCPACEREVHYTAAYCHFCGQALEWED